MEERLLHVGQMEESEAFVKYYAELRGKVADPEEIAAELYVRDVITENEKNVIANMVSAAQMDKLLPAVQRAIRISKKKNFDIFMEVLGAKYVDLVEEMNAARKG